MKKAIIVWLGFEWECPYCGSMNNNYEEEYIKDVILECLNCDKEVHLVEE